MKPAFHDQHFAASHLITLPELFGNPARTDAFVFYNQDSSLPITDLDFLKFFWFHFNNFSFLLKLFGEKHLILGIRHIFIISWTEQIFQVRVFLGKQVMKGRRSLMEHLNE